MPTEDAYSSGHLVLSHFGTCKCSNVETNLPWSFDHPSILLFLPCPKVIILFLGQHLVQGLHYFLNNFFHLQFMWPSSISIYQTNYSPTGKYKLTKRWNNSELQRWTSGATLRIFSKLYVVLSKLYDIPVGFVTPPLFWGCVMLYLRSSKVAVGQYRMICLVLLKFKHNILFKKVTHNILVYRQVQIIVAVTCVLYISYIIEYKEFWGFLVDFMLLKRKKILKP